MADWQLEDLLSRRKVTPDGHWLWQGARMPDGRGTIGGGSQKALVTRVVLGLSKGDPRQALHKNVCGLPRCFNPEHLYVGTDKDNAKDRLEVGKQVSGFGVAKRNKKTCPQGHLYEIYGGRRRCRTCHNARWNGR